MSLTDTDVIDNSIIITIITYDYYYYVRIVLQLSAIVIAGMLIYISHTHLYAYFCGL